MNSKSMRFYKINLAFGIISFLITISFRTEMIYSIIDDIHTALTILEVWNWLMLISLGIGSVQTAILTYKFGGVVYYLWCTLIMALLIFTAIGMFLVPPGVILSMYGRFLTLSLSTDLLVNSENFMSQRI